MLERQALQLPGSPVLRLLRPWHWLKNAFVLAPLLLTGAVTSLHGLTAALAATVLFCLAASAVYVWNDLQDEAADRRHPVKRHTRPIAAGHLSRAQAYTVLTGLLVLLSIGALLATTGLGITGLATTGLAATGAGGLVAPIALVPIAAYLGLNAAYSLGLKHLPIVDVLSVASGFVLRVYAGALAIGAAASPWMLIAAVCLALYLALTKRRQEQARHGTGARPALATYRGELLDRWALVAAAAAIASYAVYGLVANPGLALTLPLVLYGFLRYRYLVETRGQGEAPVQVLRSDRVLALTVTAWMGLSTFAVWLP